MSAAKGLDKVAVSWGRLSKMRNKLIGFVRFATRGNGSRSNWSGGEWKLLVTILAEEAAHLEAR
jgi:hypothetical protein